MHTYIHTYIHAHTAEKAQPGAYVTLSNAKIDMYKGSMRLVVDKSGQVEEAAGQTFSPKVWATFFLKYAQQ
jgi:ssDNA-binding replication factor A large subunit